MTTRTLTGLIAEAHEAHILDKPVAECRCGAEMNLTGHRTREHRAHLATVTVAVVADWLESDEVRALAADAIFAEHEPAYHAQETRTKLRGVLERQFGEAATTAASALAAEARKGADQ